MNNTENDYLPTDLGNVSLNPRGEYDLETAYEYLDTVSYQGGSYVCRVENGTTITGTAPEPGRNTDIWQLLTLPGGLRADYIAMHDDVVNKAAQVEISRSAVEQTQQEVEAAQADVQQLHEDTIQAAQDAENSRDSAAGYAQSAEASRKAAAESEQNINAQMTGLDQKVSDSVTKATGDIATARQQAIDTITTQEDTSTEAVKQVGNAVLESAEQALQKLNTAGQQAVRAVTDQQNTSIQVVKDETKSYIEEKKQEISDKTDEVTQAVNQAGEKQLQDIANSLDSTLSESGKAANSKAVGDAIASVEESKANKSALATTDRKLDALWKLNQGISYQFEEDSEPAYQKMIPTGAKMASVKQIGGKTIVWNQLNANNAKTKTVNGITFTNNLDGTWTVNGTATDKAELEVNRGIYTLPLTAGHIYLIQGCPEGGDYSSYMIGLLQSGSTKLGQDMGKGAICKATATTNSAGFFITVINPTTIDNLVFRPQLFDLTKMFGAGNEPSTVEEFEAMFPEEYYPYNEGTLLSMPVNTIIKIGRNIFDLQKYQTQESRNYSKPDIDDTYTDILNGLCDTFLLKLDKGTYTISMSTADDSTFSGHYIRVKGTSNNTSSQTFIINKNKEEVIIQLRTYGTGVKFRVQIEKGSIATSYLLHHQENYQIPQAILDLPGYGWSAGNVCNYVDWESKEYIQRVEHKIIIPTSVKTWGGYFVAMVDIKFISHNGVASNYMVSQPIPQASNEIALNMGYTQIILNNVDFQSNDNWLEYLTKNPIDLYYEIDPLVTDLSDIIPEGFLEALEVEPGGSLTFQNSNGDGYKVPVPNTVEYAVKLSEVAE